MMAMVASPFIGGVASAAPIVDFMSGVGGGGTISYLGGGGCPVNSLCGVNITIEKVGGIATPANAGTTFDITQGLLNFTTGSLISYSNGVYTFAGGGANSFSITGSVPGGSIPNGALASGQISSVTIDTTSPTGVYLTVVNGSGTMSSLLASLFGLGNDEFNFVQGSIHLQPTISCTPSCSSGTAFGGNAFSIFLPGAPAAPTPAPEPGTLALLGTGLLAMASSGRMALRRLRSASRP